MSSSVELRGKAWKYGDDVDTDVIIPARYLNTSDPSELARHCMEDIDVSFASKVLRVTSSSPEELRVRLLAGARPDRDQGVRRVGGDRPLVRRIFYRNAFNMGLPIFEAPGAVDEIEAGDRLAVDMERGSLRNETKGKEYRFTRSRRSCGSWWPRGGC